MSKIRKALVGAAGAFLAVIAQALSAGVTPDWGPTLGLAAGVAVAAAVAVWATPNKS